MCIQPVETSNGVVACRKCKQCQDNRIWNYVGRCLAEQQSSNRTLALTLTYGTNHPHADFLVYRDVQLLLKKLRKAGYKVRYIVSGEYGARKARAHWHLVLFLSGDQFQFTNENGNEVFVNPPATPKWDQERENWPYWPHGFTYFQSADIRGFRYLLKYILKDRPDGTKAAGHFALSKKPPLGFSYLTDLARSYARNGHLPAKPTYSIDSKEYFISASSRDAFLMAYASEYFARNLQAPVHYPEWAGETIEADPHKWRGYFDNLNQPFILSPVMGNRYPLPGPNYHGPIGPVVQLGWRDPDGDFTPNLKAQPLVYDWRSVVGPRRADLYDQDSRRIVAATFGRARVRHPRDTCECAACCARRAQVPLLRRIVDSPTGYSRSVAFAPLEVRHPSPQGTPADRAPPDL